MVYISARTLSLGQIQDLVGSAVRAFGDPVIVVTIG